MELGLGKKLVEKLVVEQSLEEQRRVEQWKELGMIVSEPIQK
jgi:hypothetical protein